MQGLKNAVRRATTLGVLGTLAALSFSAPAVRAEQVVLRVADVLPDTHYVVKYLTRRWMDDVEKATGNAVKFEYYPAQQLGKAKDMLALTLSGAADIAYVVPSYISDKLPLSAVAQLPGGFSSSCQGTRAFWALAENGVLAEKEFKPNGIRVLAALVQPPYQLFTTQRPIDSVDKLAGLKIRTTGGAMDITMQKLQAVPVRMPGPEILESLRRGTIDGGVFPPASVLANDWQTTVKHGTVGANFGSFVLTYSISEARFAKLPENVRKALVEVGREATMRTCEMVDKDLEGAIQKLRDAGVTMNKLPDDQATKLGEMLAPVAAEWAQALDARSKPGTEVLQAFRKAVR